MHDFAVRRKELLALDVSEVEEHAEQRLGEVDVQRDVALRDHLHQLEDAADYAGDFDIGTWVRVRLQDIVTVFEGLVKADHLT